MTRTGPGPKVACMVLSGWLIAPPAALPGATIRVGGRCTLGSAILAANRDAAAGGCPRGAGADTISLTGDVVLNAVDNPDNGLPPISSVIKISGNGFSVRRADSAARFRIFDVRRDGELTLEELTVSNGSTAEKGGGIRSLGVLVLRNTTVSGNDSDDRGGGIYAKGQDAGDFAEVTLIDSRVSQNTARRGAGITGYDYTNLRITGSTIANNEASSRGGGLLLHNVARAAISNSTISGNSGSSGAGLRATFYSDLDISRSTISDNTSTRFEGGGIFSIDSDVRLDRTLVSGNRALRGGGIFSDNEYGEISVRSSTILENHAVESGGGIFATSIEGYFSLKNSTVSGNSAERGGGIYEVSTYYRFESEIVHSTVTRNAASRGAGIYGLNSDPQYHQLIGSIVAGNDGEDCAGGGLFDGGANFDGDGTCPGADAIVAGVDFDLELSDHGGATPTHALLEGSVAIDAHPDCFLTTDQRLFARDELCDSGSFEFGAQALGASVTGVTPGKIYCKNRTTGSRGRSTTSMASWLCSDLGVSAKPSDRVLLWSIGTADGTAPVGGSVLGVEEVPKPRVVCRNQTTGEKVKFAPEGPNWDCEAAGLVVAPGDSIQQKIKGQA